MHRKGQDTMKQFLTTMFLAACMASSAGVQAQTVAPFKAGDRVAFVGNSITDGGHYHSYIWLYYMTHFPQMRLWMANCGVGGNTSLDILQRLDSDVFDKRPTVLTLTFGMNDTGYSEYTKPGAEAFGNKQVGESRKHFLEIEKVLKQHHEIRPIMIGTSPYDQTSKGGGILLPRKNDFMKKIIAFQDSAAKANHWEFVDFNQPMLDINAEHQATDPKFTLCGVDRVHPDNVGHMVMAYIFLKAQGMAGRNVASIGVDARKKRFTESDNCTLSNLSTDKNHITFDYLAKSLPYPLDTIAHGSHFTHPQSQITKLIPTFMQEMDNEQLRVTGLKAKTAYQLTIDSVLIDTLSAETLEKGVNLANYRNTPQYNQALAIMALNESRWEVERKFRDYAWLQYNLFMKHGLLGKNDEEAAEVFRQGETKDFWVAIHRELYDQMIHKDVRDVLQEYQDMVVDRIYKINKPVTRRIKLTQVK